MISISKKEIESLSQSTGFLQNQTEKTVRAIQILRDIAGHPFLGASLVLKGGTGLNTRFFPTRIPRRRSRYRTLR